MRLTVLGSCGGFPVPGRACSGYLVEAAGRNLWIDAGTGTLDQLLRHCDLWELDAIWISHLHPDHWTDLPIALHRMALTAPEAFEPLRILGPPGWDEDTGVAAQWRMEDDEPVFAAGELSDGLRIAIGDVELEAVAMDHSVPTFGLRIIADGVTLGYSADSTVGNGVDTVAADVDLFLCAAMVAPGTESPLHLNPVQASEVASRGGSRELLLTHLWPAADPDQYLAAAAETFDGPVQLASQGLQVTLRSSRS